MSRREAAQKKSAALSKMLARTRQLADTFYHFVNNEWFYDTAHVLSLEQARAPLEARGPRLGCASRMDPCTERGGSTPGPRGANKPRGARRRSRPRSARCSA